MRCRSSDECAREGVLRNLGVENLFKWAAKGVEMLVLKLVCQVNMRKDRIDELHVPSNETSV